MSQPIEAMSDVDLLGVMVGSKAASRMLKDAGGSLSTLLNQSIASYDPQPKVITKLHVGKELVRRSLAEALRQRDCLSSPATVRDYALPIACLALSTDAPRAPPCHIPFQWRYFASSH